MMKLLLIASWITALQTYPQSSPADGQFAGYPPRSEIDQSQISAPQTSFQPSSGCNNNMVSCDSSGGDNMAGYPAQREMGQDQVVGGAPNENQFTGYPAPRGKDENQNVPNGFKQESDFNNEQEKGNIADYTDNSINQEQQQQTQIQKHIYFHAAPPEPESPQQQQMKSLGARQKHYTIIFIDTSRLSGPTPQQQQRAAVQNEEKTIVYVLVKKPDDQPDTNAPTTPIAAPNKPEVFFIKYKEQRESKSSMPTPGMEQQQQEGDAPYPAKMDSGPKYRRHLF